MAEWEMPGKNLFSGEITIYGKYQKIKNSIRNVIYMLTEEHPLKPEYCGHGHGFAEISPINILEVC